MLELQIIEGTPCWGSSKPHELLSPVSYVIGCLLHVQTEYTLPTSTGFSYFEGFEVDEIVHTFLNKPDDIIK
jgi:hypothetical protein